MEIFGCPQCETEWLHWGQKVCPDCGGAMKWYVDALTVSKQEESTVSEVACEQTNKDSLHVARQNIPTHPTEHIGRLAQEVESDMRWKEREPT